MTHITFDPRIPLALWLPLAIAAAGLLAWYGVASRSRLARARWWRVMGLMTLAVAVPLVVLLNPTWQERIPPPAGKPVLTILVDRSASMATPDAGGTATRYEQACALASEVADRLADRYAVEIRTFATDCRPADAEGLAAIQPDGAATDVASAIDGMLAEDRPQGQAMLLLSDGIHNTGGGAERIRQSLEKARAMAAPVYTHTFGQATGVRDLEVRLARPRELAFVGQQLPVEVTLDQKGSLGRKTNLVLTLGDQVIERRDAKLEPDGTATETFLISQPESGLFRYQVRADALPDEVTDLNNRATLVVCVIDEPVRVLLLEGKPYWDTKFFARTLLADRSIELTSIVRLAEGRVFRRTISRLEDEQPPGETIRRRDDWAVKTDASKILAEPEALAGYRIVVLGQDAEVFLSDEALERLQQWLLREDGSLVCFRGPPASRISERLEKLMPVRWNPSAETRFRVQMTSEGKDLKWLGASAESENSLAGLPSLAADAIPEQKEIARVLATSTGAGGETVPVITYRHVGLGRVVVVEGAGMWRWAFLPPQHKKLDATYQRFWQSLTRWLVSEVGLLPGQRLALRADKVTFRPEEAAAATLLLSPKQLEAGAPHVILTGPALEKPKTVAPVPSGDSPDQFRVVFGTLPEGVYEAKVVDAKDEEVSARTAFDVRGHLRERLEIAARSDLMKFIADSSGGAVLEGADPDELARRFDEHLSSSRPERIARTAAWDRWWVLVAALALWGTTWGLRRWSGLV